MMLVYKILWIFKAYLYVLVPSVLSFLSTTTHLHTIPFLGAHLSQIPKHLTTSQFSNAHKSPKATLLSDYLNLVAFSRKMEGYGQTVEEFSGSFTEGLSKSLAFYQAATIGQSEISSIVEAKLCGNSSLYHPIKKPRATQLSLSTAFSSLQQFAGKWHGNWKNMQVHHLWLPVRKLHQPITDDVTLMGFQSCFIGDGFGWNYVVKQCDQILMLGYVVHFADDGTIRSENPHYGFLNNSNQLIWVAEDHVYHEFICNHSGCASTKHYVISGAGYEQHTERLKLTDGFQTIYSSHNRDLLAFKHVDLNNSNF